MVDDAPAPPSPYGFARCFGVIDTTKDSRERSGGEYALLPNAVLCFGMSHDGALDALIELRGGARAEELRDA